MPSHSRSAPLRGQTELFPGFDPRQRPLFPGDPLYRTGILPIAGAPNPPEAVPALAAGAPDPTDDRLEFVGPMWLAGAWQAEFGE